jgi:hypothetical protein
VDDLAFPRRIVVDKSGNVTIPVVTTSRGTERALHINFDQSGQRAQVFLRQRLGQGKEVSLVSVEVDKTFVDKLRASAVLQGEKAPPGTPLVVDWTKAAGQFQLTSDWIEFLRRSIIPGTGKVHQ